MQVDTNLTSTTTLWISGWNGAVDQSAPTVLKETVINVCGDETVKPITQETLV